MISTTLALLAALLLMWTAPVGSLRAQPITGANSEGATTPVQEGLALAKVFQPRDLVVKGAIAQLDRGFVDIFLAVPEFADLERERPGFAQAYWTEAKPDATKVLERRYPELLAGLAKIYAERLTLEEMRGVRAFFSGATGQKFIRIAHSSIDMKAMFVDMASDPEFNASRESLQAGARGSAAAATAAMTDLEKAELTTFMMSALGRKLVTITPLTQSFVVSWINAEDPEYEKMLAEAAQRAWDRLSSAAK